MRHLFAFTVATTCACGGSAPTQQASLSPEGTSVVRGAIQNDEGWRLEGVSVFAVSEAERGARIGLSDAEGNFVLEDLRTGSYRLLFLRGPQLICERTLVVPEVAVRDVHFVVPALFGDRPSERDRPIVDRALVRTAGP